MSEVRNIPRLRFPVYLEEFKKIKLGDISDFISKGTTPKKFINEGVNYIKIESLLGLNIQKDKCTFISEKTHLNELKRSILEENDILFAIAGATIGKIGIVTKNILPANTNQALSIIRLKDKSCIPYVLQVLESKTMKKYIVQSISVGAQPNLNLKQINDFEFYSPSISEQQKIADFLTVVDKRIELLKKKKTLLETYKKGVMKKIFNQEIRFKDDNGSDFPDWEESSLGKVAQITTGNSNRSDSESFGEFVFFDRSIDVRMSSTYLLDTEAIIVAGEGSDFIPRYFKGKFGLHQRTYAVYDFVDSYGKFLFYWIYYFRYFFLKTSVGSTVPSLRMNSFIKFPLSLPCKKEQFKISQFLSSIDTQIELLETQIDKSNTWKKGLLQKMFV